jgi:hypothetical protein
VRATADSPSIWSLIGEFGLGLCYVDFARKLGVELFCKSLRWVFSMEYCVVVDFEKFDDYSMFTVLQLRVCWFKSHPPHSVPPERLKLSTLEISREVSNTYDLLCRIKLYPNNNQNCE